MLRRNRKRLLTAAVLAAVLIPAIWLSTRKAIEGMRASDDEKILRPFAWFAPEAFGDVGLPSKSVAAELARNPSASAEQRLIAAWIPFMTRDVTESLSHVGAREDAPEDPFAVRLFRAQLSQVEARGGGHTVGTFVDTRTSKPKINPETGRPYEVLVPTDPGLSLARAASGFSAAVKRISEAAPPRGAVDFLVEANLAWAMLPCSPEVDTSNIRAAILESLRKAMESDPGSLPALHLRGAVRFLSGDFAGARDDLGLVVRDQPEALGAKYLLGIALCRLGDWTEARAVLETAAAGFPSTHRAHHKALGHLALARAGAGDCDHALESCAAWWGAATTWQDVVIPRVIAANIRKNQGRMPEARDLLVAAMREEERLWQADLAQHGAPTTGPRMFLWGPLTEQLLSVAEALGDLDVVDEIHDKIDRGGIALRPNPASAESFLMQNLAGLRPADADRIKTSPVYGASENR
jgi:tetratricopeptide (TPR) repeat protein